MGDNRLTRRHAGQIDVPILWVLLRSFPLLLAIQSPSRFILPRALSSLAEQSSQQFSSYYSFAISGQNYNGPRRHEIQIRSPFLGHPRPPLRGFRVPVKLGRPSLRTRRIANAHLVGVQIAVGPRDV